MAYVRLSIVKPRRGREQEVERLLLDLTAYVLTQPGCLGAHVLRPEDQSGEYGRIAIYAEEKDADHVANTPHAMSVRSLLHEAIEEGHEERAFFTMEPKAAAGG